MSLSYSHYDALIIGGGAAGFFGAITIAEQSQSPLKIAILERGSQVLQKVRISGGGRCNVTQDTTDLKALTQCYPRGNKALIGPFHHFSPSDMMLWLERRGIPLKTESDGRVFPMSNNSQTIIDCFLNAIEQYNIELETKTKVLEIHARGSEFEIVTGSDSITATHLLLATGGTRLPASEHLPSLLSHRLLSAVPSLFTFTLSSSFILDLAGVSIPYVKASIKGLAYTSEGPLLFTHWGLSGPCILRLSALGARELSECNYCFTIVINWAPGIDLSLLFREKRRVWGKRQIMTRSPMESLSRKFWQRICSCSELPTGMTWANLSNQQEQSLVAHLTKMSMEVSGKSINKEEFVTCGGVDLDEVNLHKMESKIHANLYFAGEVLNVDGITGGYNFQNAWTSGFLAGRTIASRLAKA